MAAEFTLLLLLPPLLLCGIIGASLRVSFFPAKSNSASFESRYTAVVLLALFGLDKKDDDRCTSIGVMIDFYYQNYRS